MADKIVVNANPHGFYVFDYQDHKTYGSFVGPTESYEGFQSDVSSEDWDAQYSTTLGGTFTLNAGAEGASDDKYHYAISKIEIFRQDFDIDGNSSLHPIGALTMPLLSGDVKGSEEDGLYLDADIVRDHLNDVVEWVFHGSKKQDWFASPEAAIFVTAFGNGGDDHLLGSLAIDTMHGGAGDDIMLGGGGIDTLSGDSGKDVIVAGSGGDDLFGGSGDDRLIGHSGEDTLSGGGGSDTLFGGADSDILKGGRGADEIHGGGTDSHSSLDEHDHFLFTSASDSGTTSATEDRLFDFDRKGETGDKIDVSALHLTWSEIDIASKGPNVQVSIASHGTVKPDMIFEVMHIAHLHKGDFIL